MYLVHSAQFLWCQVWRYLLEQKSPNSETIGISSGASAPEGLVQNLLNKVKKGREVTVEEVIVAEEKVIFKLPKQLN